MLSKEEKKGKREEKRKRAEENKEVRIKKEDKIRETFAKRLFSARQSSGKNKSTISQDTGVGLSMLGSYESAEKTAGVATAKILADYLGVSLDWLCGEGPDKRTMLNVNDSWLDIPPFYALLVILNKYSPQITIGDGEKTPDVRLSFNLRSFGFPGEKPLVDFFKYYEQILQFEKSGLECGVAIDVIIAELAKKYIDVL